MKNYEQLQREFDEKEPEYYYVDEKVCSFNSEPCSGCLLCKDEEMDYFEDSIEEDMDQDYLIDRMMNDEGL